MRARQRRDGSASRAAAYGAGDIGLQMQSVALAVAAGSTAAAMVVQGLVAE